jgi:O-antigen ligase
MHKASTHSFELRRSGSSTPTIDRYATVTIFACAYATIIGPLITYGGERPNQVLKSIQNAEPGLVGRIFLPAMAAVSLVLAIRNFDRLRRWAPHMTCLLAYVAFAGASLLWAFRPEASFVRFAQQMMLLSPIVLPAMLAARTADLMRGIFLCFAVGAVLNVFVGYQNLDGYSGYLMGKNALGEFSGIAFLLALHETLYPGFRRVLGFIIVVIAVLLLLWSHSKTAFALAFICPLFAGIILTVRKATRISPAITLFSILLCYQLVSTVSGFNLTNLSWHIYGNYTFSGRTFIWDFAFSEIARRPLLGWGYQSFWLVGSDAPSVVEAPGWIGMMPNAHNGYYDTMLELGYVGFGLLVVFILATLHAIGRVADCDWSRAWILLSLALYVVLNNFLETSWMHGGELLWVVFVIVAAEIGRYCRPFPPVVAQRWPRNRILSTASRIRVSSRTMQHDASC